MNRGKEIPTDNIFIERFLSKLEQIKDGDNCWIWKWAKTSQGYGSVSYRFIPLKAPSRFLAHRVSFYLKYKSLDNNLVIDHKCSNRLCINPNHLQEVSMYTNICLEQERYPEKFRAKNVTYLPLKLLKGACIHGHKITSYSDMFLSDKTWKCIECKKQWMKNCAHSRKNVLK